MFFKKKKPFVRFVNLMPGVEYAHPILKSSDYKWDWLRIAALDYKEQLKSIPADVMFSGTNRCPGINQLSKTGFIVTAPIDFTIKTKKDDDTAFKWAAPTNAKFQGQDYIGFHGPNQLSKYIPFRSDTLKTLIKVQTRWRIFSSSDIVFLQMPIAYPDHTAFTSATGILDPEQSIEMNVQLYWHVLDGDVTVKAGTPLCQLVPIPRDFAVNFQVDTATEEDRYVADAWNYISNMSFLKDVKPFLEASKKLIRNHAQK
jgi:hypothetical protein